MFPLNRDRFNRGTAMGHLEYLICTDGARLRETGNICERCLAIIDARDELDEMLDLLRRLEDVEDGGGRHLVGVMRLHRGCHDTSKQL